MLVAPRNTLNIGAVARAMSNFGTPDLRVARIFRPDFREAASAVGPAAALLAAARDYATLAEAIHDAHLVVGTTGALRPGFAQPLARLEQGAATIREALDRGERVAMLFGSEKFGLSNDDLSHCHLLLRIPTRDEHASMNLGQAAALCLYELARQPGDEPTAAPATVSRDEPASAASVDRLTALLAEALAQSEYPGMGYAARDRQLRGLQLRNMVRRLHLSERDASMAMGFLRQMLWKLSGGGRK